MADLQAINDLFAPPGGELPGDVANELQAIARLLSLSPQEMFFKWESYVMKMGADNIKMDYKTVRDFKKDLQDALERESRAKSHAVPASSRKTAATPRASTGGGDVFGMIDGMSTGSPAPRTSGAAKRKAGDFATPASKSSKAAAHSSPSDAKTAAAAVTSTSVAFEERTNSGQIIESLNSHLDPCTSATEGPTESRVKLKANTELPKFAYKGMAMKLSEASEILDDRIDTFTEMVQKYHDLEDAAFGNPAAQSTSEVVAVGRIACDEPNGKLNSASVVLETSRRMGAGMRVPLKFDGTGCDIFPGKIVALRGTNVSGEYFTVTEVLELPPLPPAASEPSELQVTNQRLEGDGQTGRPLNMLVASGPYTTDADLSFAPLHALLEKAEDQKADVVVLSGPFLDLEHPLVASGDFEDSLPSDAKIEPDRATLNDVFRILIGQPIQKFAQAVPTATIIMVPSMRDAINRHVSWPQDRFPKATLGLPKQVHVVTNPITISINEVVVGISSQDVLSELRRENVYHPGKAVKPNPDVLARLTSALIEQRHYFPVFPPQARENLSRPAEIPGEVGTVAEERLAVGASLDLTYLKLGEWLNLRPDILILPSTLSPFAKVVDSVVCVNPSTLSKKRGAGTYAALAIQPASVTDEHRAADELMPHEIFNRARVDVTRV